jgi:hypothetical protein
MQWIGKFQDRQIPAQTLAALSTEQYLSLLDEEHGPFDMLDQAELGPLVALSNAIETLVARGAANVNFKGIYCENCKFSPGRSFDQAIFDDAYLANADFAHKSLRSGLQALTEGEPNDGLLSADGSCSAQARQ